MRALINTQIRSCASARSVHVGWGRSISFARFGSAFSVPERRHRGTSCRTTPPPLTQPTAELHNTQAYTRRGLHSLAMHRAPAAMVSKPMTDPNIVIRTPRDPNTLSNYHNFVTRHTIADFEIDFSKKILNGSVTLQLESLTEKESQEVILDTRYA
jgi:hypothetical protein